MIHFTWTVDVRFAHFGGSGTGRGEQRFFSEGELGMAATDLHLHSPNLNLRIGIALSVQGKGKKSE